MCSQEKILGGSRRGALAIHRVLTPCECVKAPGWCTITPCEVCRLGVTLLERLRKMKVLEAESLPSDHTKDLGKAGI